VLSPARFGTRGGRGPERASASKSSGSDAAPGSPRIWSLRMLSGVIPARRRLSSRCTRRVSRRRLSASVAESGRLVKLRISRPRASANWSCTS
jgi:hypothetical protein